MTVTIQSVPKGEEPMVHAQMGIVLEAAVPSSSTMLDVSSIKQRCGQHVRGEDLYAGIGNDYQGEFRSCSDVWVGEREVLSRVEFAVEEEQNVALRSCAWLDACGHGGLLLLIVPANSWVRFVLTSLRICRRAAVGPPAATILLRCPEGMPHSCFGADVAFFDVGALSC